MSMGTTAVFPIIRQLYSLPEMAQGRQNLESTAQNIARMHLLV